MRKRLTWAALLAALLTFAGCAGKETSEPKVEAENDYNEMAGRTEQSDIAEDQLSVTVIRFLLAFHPLILPCFHHF